MKNEFIWAFNFKVFVAAYRNLGYNSSLDDWNVRFSDGLVLLDNLQTRSTVSFNVLRSILDIEVRPWSLETDSPKFQNIDLADVGSGWRDNDYKPVRAPAPEGVALIEHLKDLGYISFGPVASGEDLPDGEEGYHGMRVQDFWGDD